MSQRILATAAAAALLGATAGAGATWAVWGARSDPACEDAGEAEKTRQRIADLEREIAALRERGTATTLAPRSERAPPLPATVPPSERPADAPGMTVAAGGPRERASAAKEREPAPAPSTAWTKAEPWAKALRSLPKPSDSHPVLLEIRAALSGQDGMAAEAALIALQAVDPSALDRAAWRALLEPFAAHPDGGTRLQALGLLHRIDPRPTDVERWIAEVRRTDSNGAERAVQGLVAAADGIVEGAVADAILHALRDGTDIPRAGVVRGVANGKFVRLDPRVLDRMLAIARGMPPSDYQCYYFFHFVAPRLEPRPPAVVDLALKIVETPGGLGGPGFVATLSGGLEGTTRLHVLERMWAVAELGQDRPATLRALEVLKALAGRDDAARLERIADDANRPPDVRAVARRAADVASSRD